MYMLKDNGVINELECGNNFEYLLDSSTHFVNTDYKVLQSQTNGVFIRCMKLLHNGRTALYYVTDEYRPLSSMLANITPEFLLAAVINLFADVIEVRNNGFLACESIELSWDKVFVEQNTLKVKLVYLPINVKAFDSYAEFESELRSGVVKLVNKVITASGDRLDQFVSDLSNGSLSLEDVYNRNRSRGSGTPPIVHGSVHSEPADDRLRMVAMNAQGHFEIIFDRDETLIGKKRELVDEVISFNNMISRKHCRVSRINGSFYISDEESANGTYVNRVRLEKGQRQQIKRGDIVRLANSDFQII